MEGDPFVSELATWPHIHCPMMSHEWSLDWACRQIFRSVPEIISVSSNNLYFFMPLLLEHGNCEALMDEVWQSSEASFSP